MRCANGGTTPLERRQSVVAGRIETYDARERNAGFAQAVARRLAIGEDQTRTRVLDNVPHVVERLRRIDRHDDASGEERRKVGHDPVDAVVRDERHAVTRFQSRLADRAGQIRDPFEQRRTGERFPRTGDPLDEGVVPRLGERIAYQLRQRGFRRELRRHRTVPMREPPITALR